MTCNNTARSRALLQLFSKTARYNAQILICPVPNWLPHRSNARFATLDGRHALQTPMWATVPPTAPPPVQSPTEKQAGRTKCSDTLGNNSAVFRAKLTKLGGDVGYAVVILRANFQPLAPNSSCPKALAFKMRRGPRGLQAACKLRKRHVTCNKTARSRAFLQLFSKTARYSAQILICPVPNWLPHRSNTRFATLDGRHALQTPMWATVPPTAPPPCPEPNGKAGGPDKLVRYAGQ